VHEQAISLNLDEQRLANVITVKAQTPCKNLQETSTKEKKKLQQQIHT
jgi:hypothetical protein